MYRTIITTVVLFLCILLATRTQAKPKADVDTKV